MDSEEDTVPGNEITYLCSGALWANMIIKLSAWWFIKNGKGGKSVVAAHLIFGLITHLYLSQPAYLRVREERARASPYGRGLVLSKIHRHGSRRMFLVLQVLGRACARSAYSKRYIYTEYDLVGTVDFDIWARVVNGCFAEAGSGGSEGTSE